MNNPPEHSERALPIGVEVTSVGVHARLHAPRCKHVAVVTPDKIAIELAPSAGGYFSAACEALQEGSLYKFQLDGELYPDPASRFQPEGPHGWSQVIDPRKYRWNDHLWNGPQRIGQVYYEMHIGTFTKDGTWQAAIEELSYLHTLGISCIELMPVSEFPGNFNWGYDGVNIFAPTRNYGVPDDFRRFVDCAHQLGIAVILDVVYNHFGPDGNFIHKFSDTFFSTTHSTDWGDALNFDGEGSGPVREFYIANSRYWISEFHLDGFRFDATQNIYDDSSTHILTELAEAARSAAPGKQLLFISENEPQDTDLVRSVERGGKGLSALWNDDFHHAARVALSGRSEAYLSDYRGKAQEFAAAAKWGYLYQGQYYTWQKKRRGHPAFDLLPDHFVHFIQNHDQIANISNGRRLHKVANLSLLRAMTCLMLLGPQSPLIFQGQEFMSSANFEFFADHTPELSELMRKGRRKELRQFPSLSETLEQELHITRDAFERSKLNHSEKYSVPNSQMLYLHRDLLKLRKQEPFCSCGHSRDFDVSSLSDFVLVIRFFHGTESDRLLAVNLGNDWYPEILPEPLLGTPDGFKWEIEFSSEDPIYGGGGIVAFEHSEKDPRVSGPRWQFSGQCATVFSLRRLTAEEASSELKENKTHERRKKEFLQREDG